MTEIVTPGVGLVYMKVGTHANEPFDEIFERKRKEIADEGFALWGYGGNTCHPLSMVQPFAQSITEQGGVIRLVMQPMDSRHFTVTAHVDDLAWGGPRDFAAEVPCIYDDDIERIAKSRHGDVIAYSSAMATLRRLDAAFIGDDLGKVGGLRRLAEAHATSMTLLARDTKDFAIQEQADLLVALLAATRADTK